MIETYQYKHWTDVLIDVVVNNYRLMAYAIKINMCGMVRVSVAF